MTEDLEERLHKAVANDPDRWLPEYDKEGKLVSVADRDSGRIWIKTKEGWQWAE